jgi:O-antigen ligase/tetratricopeptide (TPR) repeat protein
MKRGEWVTAVAGGASLCVAVFAVGGAPRWAQAAVGLLMAIAVLAQLGSRRVPARVSPLLLVLGLPILLTCVQLFPVGPEAVATLNATGAALRERGALVAGVCPAQTLTFDVPGSLSALAFFVTLLGVATVALRIASTERGRFGLLVAVAGTCAVAALITGIHTLAGATELYGVYAPIHAHPRLLGPMLNGNQLGCLMAVGSVVAGGLVTYPRQPPWIRAMWLVAALGCALVALATLSRGAAIALAAGVGVLGATLIGQRLSKDTSHASPSRLANGPLQIGIVAVCAVVIVVYAGSGGVTRQLEGTSVSEVENPHSKFAAWRASVELIEESPWSGWGRGAFESAFTRVHPTSGLAAFSYLENEYLQTVVDWGIPGALLIGAAGLWLAIRAVSRWRGGPLAASGLGGLTVVALQSNVDFGVEFLGLAIPVTIIAATLTHVPFRPPGVRTLRIARGIRIVHALALLAAVALLSSTATISVEEDHDHDGADEAASATTQSLNDSIERHPLDYRGYLLDAVVLMHDHRMEQAIHVLNHALALHPTHSGLHLFLGELLRQSGYPEQAAIEYATAIRSSADPWRLIAQVAARMPTPQLVARSIPTDYSRFHEIANILEREHQYGVELDWLKRVLASGTDSLRTCSVLYNLALHARQLDVISVATEKCPGYSPSIQVKHLLARNALQKEQPRTALRLLSDVETWGGIVTDKFDAWLTRCDAYVALQQLDDAERCLHRLDATGYAPKHEIIDKRLAAVAAARRAGQPTPPVAPMSPR